ncbi:MAG: F0F1 ATP synthase subunit B [Lachnospiraceae bacterium]|nr:F0F1 ATP synthase subunit B [Lachnospiraceae bacterium]
MERLFDLDLQLLHDAVLTLISVIALFFLMSHFFFNPIRDFLEKRKNKIAEDLSYASSQKEEATALKEEYDQKLGAVDKEAEEILTEARKKALATENRIVAEAKEEATRIIKRANEEAALAKQKVADDVKREMVTLASVMAGKVVAANIDTTVQETLIDETLKEIGENTWLS